MPSDTAPWMMLIENGFIKPAYRGLYTFDKKKERFIIENPEKGGRPHESHADQEVTEEANIMWTPHLVPTGFPDPWKRYRIIYESFNANLEETYFWFLGHLRQDQAFPEVDKLMDIFSASENSAFFGQSAQRMSIQEDRASNFLKGIAELVKQLFQIIRELRIIDERLVPYYDWERKGDDGTMHHSKSADSTLKGVFSDFAENKGGQMQPGSIYHLAQTVGYASLPDLFFNTHIYKKNDVDKKIDAMKQFNPNVRNVLKRKLYQFIVWKEKTYDELNSRRRFQIKYLKQHWATIKMYMAWTKPYLKHIKRLTMNESQLDSPDLVSAFETSMTEVELLFKKPAEKGVRACILATFEFKTRPLLQYRQEYQQGPVHVGRVIVTMRAYGWTDEDIERYKKLKEDEEKNLLYLVDESVSAAMEELSDDLQKYLNDAGKDVFDKDIDSKYGSHEVPSNKRVKFKAISGDTPLEPFVEVFKGAWELVSGLVPTGSGSSKGKKSSGPSSSNRQKAAEKATHHLYQTYKNYKKAHQLLSW